MGFGLLFLGYLFTVFDTGIMYIDSISVVFMQALRLFGWVIAFIGCVKLSKYVPKMKNASMCAVSLAIASAFDTVLHCATTYGKINIPTSLRTIIFVLYALFYFAFHFYMIGGLCDVTSSTGLVKENKRSKLLFYVCMFFSAVNLVACLGLWDALISLRYLMFVVITLAVSFHLFTCYMWIGLPEPEENEDAEENNEKEE